MGGISIGGYNPFDQNWDSLNPFKRPEADTSEAEAAAAEKAAIELQQQEAEDAINAVFDKFGEEDYQRVRDARTNFEDIELQDQYKDALQELEFALARGGRKGSTNIRARADAAKDWKKQKMLSEMRGDKDVKGYKTQIAQARQNMHELNIANADPAMLADTAARNAGMISAPATYEPLVDVFKSITEGFATQQEINDRKRLMNSYGRGNYA